MVKAVIFIVVLALVLQILNYVVLTSLYGIQLNLMVKSVGNKKQKVVKITLSVMYFIATMLLLGVVYAVIGDVYNIVGVEKNSILSIITSPLNLMSVNKFYVFIPAIIFINEVAVLFKKENRDTKKKIGLAIFSSVFLTYWSFMLPSGISLYWICRKFFEPSLKIREKGQDRLNKFMQKKMYKNPEAYREYLLKHQEEKAEKEKKKKEKTNDTFNLHRFIDVQNGVYDMALSEIKTGQKKNHWMWYIFPQMKGLGESLASEKYGISSIEEARAYMKNETLRNRLIKITNEVVNLNENKIEYIFPYPDHLKFRSCMTLFMIANPECEVFKNALDKFYDGKQDEKTLEFLGLEA